MKSIKSLMLLAVMVFAFGSIKVSGADKTALTPEFCEEGIAAAVDVFNEMADQIAQIQEERQIQDLPQLMDSIKLRKVRKKYGKIALTDEYRARLLEPNLRVAKELKEMVIRFRLPYELQQMLDKYVNEGFLKEELAKAKTLRDAMQ